MSIELRSGKSVVSFENVNVEGIDVIKHCDEFFVRTDEPGVWHSAGICDSLYLPPSLATTEDAADGEGVDG